MVDGRSMSPPPGGGDIADLERAAADMYEILNHALDELGTTLSPAQLRALLTIDRFGALSLRTLAIELCSSTSAASRLCDRLRQAGMITRTTAPADRRSVELRLSDAGARLVRWARERRRDTLARIVNAMPPGDRQALLRGLRGFRAAAGRDR